MCHVQVSWLIEQDATGMTVNISSSLNKTTSRWAVPTMAAGTPLESHTLCVQVRVRQDGRGQGGRRVADPHGDACVAGRHRDGRQDQGRPFRRDAAHTGGRRRPHSNHHHHRQERQDGHCHGHQPRV